VTGQDALKRVAVSIGKARNDDSEFAISHGRTGICSDRSDPARFDVNTHVVGPTVRQQCFSREYAAHCFLPSRLYIQASACYGLMQFN